MTHSLVPKDLLVHWIHISVLYLSFMYVLTPLKQVIQINMVQVYIFDSYLLQRLFMKKNICVFIIIWLYFHFYLVQEEILSDMYFTLKETKSTSRSLSCIEKYITYPLYFYFADFIMLLWNSLLCFFSVYCFLVLNITCLLIFFTSLILYGCLIVGYFYS